jgi:replicative DNA helicase
MSRGHKHYDASAVDAKFDHASDNNPVGCNWIRDNHPQPACTGCKLKAPYHMAERGILEMAAQSKVQMLQLTDLGKHLDRVYKLNAGESTSGIKLGFEGLDDVLQLRTGELVVVGGSPSMGKTAFMVDAMLRLAKSGVPVLVFSAETGRDTLTDRIVGNVAKVDTTALRGERSNPLTPDEWNRVAAARDIIEKLPLFLDFTSLTPEQVFEQVETTLLSHGLDLDAPYVIFFDYLQFGVTVTGTANEYERLSVLVTSFKFLAKMLEHPVVVFSQLKRESEGEDKPEITWFKGSGRIESDMDSGIIITGARASTSVAPRRLTIVKQREGRANVGIEFHLQQQFGHWEYISSLQMEEPRLDRKQTEGTPMFGGGLD